jgi:hypothetical protein
MPCGGRTPIHLGCWIRCWQHAVRRRSQPSLQNTSYVIYIYPQSVRTLTRRAVCMMLHIIILTSSCKIRHMYVPCVSHLPSQRGGVYTCRR